MKRISFIPSCDRRTLWCLLIAFVAVAAIVVEGLTGSNANNDTSEMPAKVMSKEQPYAVETKPVKLQPFDPNTADSTLLLSLGLQPWQVRSIYKYRAAGGAYTCPDDFARLYGLTRKKFLELRPYIRIGKDYRPARELIEGKRHNYDVRTHNISTNDHIGTSEPIYNKVQKLKVGETLNLNTADTTALKTVPGIGPYFAQKIVFYRNLLGGYVSTDQLLELIDRFPEQALPYLSITNRSAITRININAATEKQLSRHPYITYKMAKEITSYRRLRGRITDLSDLMLLPSFTKQTTERLRDYIEY